MTDTLLNNSDQQYTFDTANIIIHDANIIEVVIKENVVVSLEMLEKFEQLISSQCQNRFTLLINKIYRCSFAFETQLCTLSLLGLVATAKVYYHDDDQHFLPAILKRQKVEQLNLKSFMAANNGYNNAKLWLTEQLN